jgi:hypothetical protein
VRSTSAGGHERGRHLQVLAHLDRLDRSARATVPSSGSATVERSASSAGSTERDRFHALRR